MKDPVFSDGHKVVKIDLPSSAAMDIEEVTDLIQYLGFVRGTMEPADDMAADPDPRARMVMATEGRWYFGPIEGERERFALHLQTPQFRWVGLEIDRGSAESLRDRLSLVLKSQ